MRLGLIGLGRIGAFHAATLTELEAVDSLVVYDAAPALVDAVVHRHGAEPASSVEALLAADIDGVVIAAATAAHPELILASLAAGAAHLLREAGRKRPQRRRRDPARHSGLRRAGSDRLPAPLRCRLRRGPPCGGRR